MKGCVLFLLAGLVCLTFYPTPTQSAVVKRWAALDDDDQVLDEDRARRSEEEEDDDLDLAKRWLAPSSYGGQEPSYIKRAIGGQEQEAEFPKFPVEDVGEFEGEAVPKEDDVDNSIDSSPPAEEEAPFPLSTTESPVPQPPPKVEEEEIKDNDIEVDQVATKAPRYYYDKTTTEGYSSYDYTTTTYKPWHKKAWHYVRDKVFRFGRDTDY